MEISDVRRRVRGVIEESRRAAAARRQRADAASAAYDHFLSKVANPVFQMVANVLKIEGYPFTVFTPAGGLTLASDKSGDSFIELALDTAADVPTVVGRVSRARGQRVIRTEHPIREGAAVEQLTEEDVLEFLLRDLAPFVER